MWGAQSMLMVKQKELEQKKEEEERRLNHVQHPDDFDVSGPCNLSPPTWREMIISPWKDENYRRTVMSCFVNAAYLLELDRQEKREGYAALAPQWWKPFNYKVVEVLVDETDGSIFGATFEWDTVGALSGLVVKRPSKAPRAIIALRGTLLSAATIIKDIENDLRIFFTNDLSGSCRFRKTLEAVSTTVGKYGRNEVCMAGHSLGAALALQVGMALTLEGIIVEAHLFNPPSVSLPTFFSGIVEKLEKFCNFVKGIVRAILASEKNPNNESEQSEEQSDHIEGEIQKWVPRLYVNVADYICTYYADGFEKRKNCVMDKNESMEHMPLGMKLVSAKLYIISDSSMKIMEAHGIRQWWSCETELPIVLNGSRLIEKQLNSLIQHSHVKTVLVTWPVASTNLLTDLCLAYD